jgi:hypothetical protein
MEKGEEKKEYQPTNEEVAWHEAGHAVTGYLFYPPVTEVTIVPSDDDGFSTLGNTKATLPEPDSSDPEIKENFREYLKIILYCLSGNYFQKSANGHDDVGGAKHDRAFLLCYFDPKYVAPLNNIIAGVVDNFCSNTTVVAMVNKVANALVDKKALNQEDLQNLLDDNDFDLEQMLDSLTEKYYPTFCNWCGLFKPPDLPGSIYGNGE